MITARDMNKDQSQPIKELPTKHSSSDTEHLRDIREIARRITSGQVTPELTKKLQEIGSIYGEYLLGTGKTSVEATNHIYAILRQVGFTDDTFLRLRELQNNVATPPRKLTFAEQMEQEKPMTPEQKIQEIKQLAETAITFLQQEKYENAISAILTFVSQYPELSITVKRVIATGNLSQDIHNLASYSNSSRDGSITLATLPESQRTPEDQRILAREQALIFVEELLHFLQNTRPNQKLTEYPLPEKFPQAPNTLLGASKSEIDVALLLRDAGINLNNTYFIQRYQREDYLKQYPQRPKP